MMKQYDTQIKKILQYTLVLLGIAMLGSSFSYGNNPVEKYGDKLQEVLSELDTKTENIKKDAEEMRAAAVAIEKATAKSGGEDGNIEKLTEQLKEETKELQRMSEAASKAAEHVAKGAEKNLLKMKEVTDKQQDRIALLQLILKNKNYQVQHQTENNEHTRKIDENMKEIDQTTKEILELETKEMEGLDDIASLVGDDQGGTDVVAQALEGNLTATPYLGAQSDLARKALEKSQARDEFTMEEATQIKADMHHREKDLIDVALEINGAYRQALQQSAEANDGIQQKLSQGGLTIKQLHEIESAIELKKGRIRVMRAAVNIPMEEAKNNDETLMRTRVDVAPHMRGVMWDDGSKQFALDIVEGNSGGMEAASTPDMSFDNGGGGGAN